MRNVNAARGLSGPRFRRQNKFASQVTDETHENFSVVGDHANQFLKRAKGRLR